jgi:hypothetical protein
MKTLTRSLAALFFSLFLLACTDEERAVWPAVELSFSPAINASTRSVEGVYPADEPFEVWAFALPEGKLWNTDAAAAATLAAGSSVEFNGECWVPVPALEWLRGKSLTCFAVAPKGIASGFSLRDGVMIEDFDATSGIHPMFAGPVADCTAYNTQGCIALPFVHALSKVEFCVRSVSDSTIIVKSLTLDNVKHRGCFASLPIPHWEPDDEAMRVEFCGETVVAGRVAKSVGVQMLMGQRIDSKVVLLVDVIDKKGDMVEQGRRIEVPVFVDLWSTGKYNRYVLNLTASSAYTDSDVLKRFDI